MFMVYILNQIHQLFNKYKNSIVSCKSELGKKKFCTKIKKRYFHISIEKFLLKKIRFFV